MKKILTLTAMLMLAIVTMNAQSLNGTWKGDESVKELFGEDDAKNMSLILTFKGSKLDWCFEAALTDDTMGEVAFQFIIPSTFKRQGNTITDIRMQKEKMDFKVTKCSMGDAIKKLLEGVLKEQMTKEDGMMSEFEGIADETLTIQTLTKTKLTLESDGKALSFDRVK